jgi:LysR family transcriptional regulator, regulator for metE and metH
MVSMSDVHLSDHPLLDISHLEAICAIDHYGRLADAAASLHITPSALSHRVGEAERRLGLPLYVRAHRRLEPTAAAAYLVTTARTLLEDLARAEADSRRMTGEVRRIVRLAVDAYRSYRWLPEFLRFIRAEHPNIELQISSAGSDDPTSRVESGSLDVAIAPGDRPSAQLEDRFLFDDELVFIAPPNHPLASKAVITGPDIEGVDFITYTRTPEPDREFARLFRPSNTYPSWVETIELPEAIVEMVAAGLGTSVLARWAVENSIAQKRVSASRLGEEGITIPWHAFNRPDDDDSRAIAEQLVEWCAQHGSLA